MVFYVFVFHVYVNCHYVRTNVNILNTEIVSRRHTHIEDDALRCTGPNIACRTLGTKREELKQTSLTHHSYKTNNIV